MNRFIGDPGFWIIWIIFLLGVRSVVKYMQGYGMEAHLYIDRWWKVTKERYVNNGGMNGYWVFGNNKRDLLVYGIFLILLSIILFYELYI